MNDSSPRILIVDDDPEFVEDFKLLLPSKAICNSTSSPEEACRVLDTSNIELVFLDIDLGADINGLQLLKKIRSEWPYLPVIMVTADHAIDTIVKAMQLGASDYVGKSPNMGKLKLSIQRAISESRKNIRLDLLESELQSFTGELVGESPAMRKIKNEILKLARVRSNVLIYGQSGTGKELVARNIHKLSDHNMEPFVAVNCAALSGELFESELFGHEKGAFTGALKRRMGKFEIVGSGTLFLDEITEISIDLQAKLLRVLQEKEFERVGGNSPLEFKGRILASTNRDLNRAISDGILREDLYYRLNVTTINIPPLKDRKEDLKLLIEHFINIKSAEMKKSIEGIEANALKPLLAYDWPGNVRELANCIENAIVHCEGPKLQAEDFHLIRPTREQSFDSYDEAKNHVLRKFQREYISNLLAMNNGNISETARQMKVSRPGLMKIMENCNLDNK